MPRALNGCTRLTSPQAAPPAVIGGAEGTAAGPPEILAGGAATSGSGLEPDWLQAASGAGVQCLPTSGPARCGSVYVP
jgi:hypothetical protein